MIKIIALNEARSNENEDEYVNTLTKEAQEQVALNEYNRALELLIKNKKEEALNVLNELLNTELLDKVNKPQIRDGRSRPMLSLKYSCFKNVASIQAELEDYHNALYNYWAAANLDDSDVVLWYRIGLMAIKISSLDVACFAFKQGLKRNCHHWPCLDNIITVLYAIPDYMNCLLYISLALEKDPSYIKGLAFRKQIFKNIPAFQECYKIYNNSWMQDPSLDTKFDQAVGFMLLNEANELKKKWVKTTKSGISKKPLINLSLRRTLLQYSWSELGKSLVDMHRYIIDNNLNFISPVILNVFKYTDPIFTDNKSKTYYTKFYQTKTLPVQAICCFKNDKEIDTNNSVLRNKFNISVEHNSNLIEVTKTENKNKSCASEILIIEENSIIPMGTFHLKELGINGSSVFETKKEKNSTLKKDLNDKYLNEKEKEKEVISKKVSEEISHDFNNKQFENDVNIKIDEKEKSQKVKKRRRSSLCFLTQWAWSNSNIKRSTRARTSSRKDYERDGVLLEEILKRIFPSTLLPDSTRFTKKELLKSNDDSVETSDLYNLIANKESNFTDDTKSTESSKSTSPANEDQLKYFGTEQEIIDVNEFIKEHTGKSNVMIIIVKFIEFLCAKWNYEWPNELPELYIQLYIYMREHIPHSSPFIKNIDNCILKLDAEITLLFCELYTDKWLSSKPCLLPACSPNRLGIGIASDDLGYVIFYTNQDEIYNEKNFIFLLRSLWLKANIFFYQGDIEIAMKTLELLLHHMQQLQLDMCKPFFKLTNCKYNSTVNIRTVQKMLTFIQRGKRFCEIKYLYQEKKYEELSSILKETFNFSKHSNQFILCNEVPVDRVEHLQILLDTLWQLQQHEDCYVWAEVCLNESWQNYLHAINTCINVDERSKWIQLVLYSLEKLEACVIEVSTFIVRYLPESRRSRLVQNLVHIVCHQLDVLDNTPSMPIESVSPWILLHFILQYEEDKQRAKSVSTLKFKSHSSIHSDDDDDDDEDYPASLTILLKAHEFLGRHGWCSMSEGKLLLFILKLIIPRLHFPLYSSIKRKLKESVEQVIYCLYGHPSKFNSGARSKPKYIDEHVKTSINLSWEMCQLLFEFYKPEILPSFESKRVDSINIDTVILFKKMCAFIPVDSDPTKIFEEMNSYLLGNKEKMPVVKKPLPNQISYIYYLIADHYFKAASNQSWSSAVKYYIFDLCLHPNELNSWAGLAMSTSTLMETWLNNFQPNINEEKYLAKAKIAQRSYQHAIELVPSHLTIWTEFGNFLYTVHSFCSRLLKQESDSLNMKRFRILESRKEEMLDEARDCFISANNIYIACQGIDEPQDERWLYQYMLAKIAEKKNYDPPVFLKYYSKASELLNENKAQYPKRINHKNPQNLAIEALEVYYRIHASILKYLEQHEGEPLKKSLAVVLENNLKNCMQSPFVTYDSIFRDVLKKHDNIMNETKMSMHKQLHNAKKNEVFIYNTEQTIMNKSIAINNKSDIRKRYINEPIVITGVKKMKLSSVSHLQLMQDVVALIDDLITKVCDKVSPKQLKIEYHNCESKSLKNYNDLSKTVMTETNSTIQYFMDNLMKEKIELRQEKDEKLIYDDNDNNQNSNKKWFHEEFQLENFHKLDKNDDKKKIIKIERTFSRRSSQESTTTTQTSTSETNNSTSSSSDDTTSSDDSSDSSSSSDSDSDSIESNMEKKKKDSISEYTFFAEEDTTKLMEYCLSGLEQCVLKFPEHYKSIYRLAYFFFYNKVFKDVIKCKQLLLGTYECQFHHKHTIQGLFAERKNANFFNGIWRIPVNEIDRPGSFASHMSRCVVLLMQVLKETNDSRMLIELCMQLRKIPDTDKKYLRDTEREQLSCQALTLCLQSLRNRIKTMDEQNTSIDVYKTRIDERMRVLLDIYHIYQNMKNIQEYEIIELPKVRKLLEDAYVLYKANHNIQGNIFELAKECCRQKLRANKIGLTCFDSNPNTRILEDNMRLPTTNANLSALNIPFITQSRKSSQKVSVSGRPRGRPPGAHKFPQVLNNNSLLIQNQCSSKHSSASSSYVSNTSTLSNNPYCLTPFLEPNMLAAMLRPNFNANIIDSAMNYFNQAGAYQDVFRRYQDSINTISDIKLNYNKNSSSNMASIQTENIMSVTNSNLNIAKEKPDISITPVTRNKHQTKPKSAKIVTTNLTQRDHSVMSIQIPKTVEITPDPRLSLFKSTHAHQNVSQSLSNHQVSLKANTLSLGGSTIANCNPFSQVGQTTIAAVGLNHSTSRPSISLQHKLLSKKQSQRSNQLLGICRQKQKKTVLPNTYTNILKSVSAPCIPSDSTIISVDASPSNSSKYIKLSSNLQKVINKKVTGVPLSTSSLQETNSVNTLSVLSQLQQHSHLEIIPQKNHIRQDTNLINIPSRSVGVQNLTDTMNLLSAENISVYELPRCKSNINTTASHLTKRHKSEKDNVEIITLDD